MLLATRIPEEVINQVRTATNITDIISEYVELHQQGRNLFGRCPWHDERTPSFSVNEQKQIFHCFSCGRGGNVFQFLVEMKNISFPEAVIEVANQSHVDIDQQYTQPATKPISKYAPLYDLYTQAAKIYHHMLMNTAVGEQALDYLHGRGLDDDTLNLFNIGYAPPTSLLLPFFQEKGIDDHLLRESELFIENEDGTLRDRFVNRVLFTIRNANGQVIAFSGRTLSQDAQAKYINSPESVLFNKSQELFNFDLAKINIKRSKDVILFEGYMDVIAAFSAGVQNGIASMGTSLTVEQVNKLSRVAQRIFIAYDGDEAGQNATKRAIDLITQVAPKMKIQIIHLPDNLDPDEYLRKFGVEAFNSTLSHGFETPVTFMIQYLKRGRNLANEAEKLAYLDDVLHVLATSGNLLERDLQINQLAQDFNVGVASLQEQLTHLLQKNVSKSKPAYKSGLTPTNAEPQLRVLTKEARAERTLLTWMLHDRYVWQLVTSTTNFHFNDLTHETIFILAQAYWSTHTTYDLGEFFNYINDPKVAGTLSEIENDVLISTPSMTMAKELVELIMHQAPLEAQIKSKEQEIAEAKKLGNNEILITLTNEYIVLLRQRQTQQQTN